MVAGVVVLPRERMADWIEVKVVLLPLLMVLLGLTSNVPASQPSRGSAVGAWHSARL